MMYKTALFLIPLFLLSGCAAIQETTKGVIGISTKQIEETRASAILKTFPYSYKICSDKVEEALKKNNAYVYARDARKKMVAIYISRADTTPVGIFFKELDAKNTQIEVSSPSAYAKEFMAKKIFSSFEKKSDTSEPSVTQAQPSAVLVTVGNTQANSGDPVVIPVSVTDVGSLKIKSAYLKIGYDSAFLTLTTVKNGTLTSHWSEPVYNINPGEVGINLEGDTAISGSGILVKLVFTVSPFSETSTYNIDLNQATFNEGKISNKMIGGVLTVFNPDSK